MPDSFDLARPFDLDRFVAAQAPVMADAMAELRAGAKRTHWMWFVFPQVAGLGHSPTARFYALGGLAEGQAFADHPVLGGRLRTCTTLALAAAPRTAHEVFGSPDDLKFHSCMTLFGRAAGDTTVFRDALTRFFDGREDPGTVRVLDSGRPTPP